MPTLVRTPASEPNIKDRKKADKAAKIRHFAAKAMTAVPDVGQSVGLPVQIGAPGRFRYSLPRLLTPGSAAIDIDPNGISVYFHSAAPVSRPVPSRSLPHHRTDLS